ncbi:unnamed protein product [Umbelopsis ramanniana]
MLPQNRECTWWPALVSTLLTAASLFKSTNKELYSQPLECLISAMPLIIVGNLAITLFNNRNGYGSVSLIIRCLASGLVLTAVIHGFTVLLGASLVAKFWYTLAFSALVATITVFSVVNQLGITQSELYVRVFIQHRPSSNAEVAAYMQTVSILIGAWLGAVVIPLDWERPWQQWPVSCVLGALLGQAVGAVGTIVLFLMPESEEDKRKDE